MIREETGGEDIGQEVVAGGRETVMSLVTYIHHKRKGLRRRRVTLEREEMWRKESSEEERCDMRQG